jgi:processive 1,2-diacylglycerol beta-glucosyltransferase
MLKLHCRKVFDDAWKSFRCFSYHSERWNHVMTKEPRILIVSASIGSGHNQAAAAIEQELRRQHPQSQIDIVDFLTYGSSSWGNFIKETYFKMLHVFPDMYDFLYRWTSGPGHRVKNLLAYSSKKRMSKLYQHYQPDILVFTHPFPCAAAAYLRRKRMINTTLIAVITDFAVHPLWTYDEVDMYCVADSSLQYQLVEKGIPESRIMVSGIPVGAQFAISKQDSGISQEYELQGNKPTLLVMGGGLGLGPLEIVLQSIERCTLPLQLIVVAGNNKEILPSLHNFAKKSRHTIHVLGFTKEVDHLMERADLLITKPGGLTSSEALAKGLPMLLVSAIPGQEEENARFLVQQGAAIHVRDIRRIPLYLQRLFAKKPELLRSIKIAATHLGKPEAARLIAQTVLQRAQRFAAMRIAK